ncbi:MAG: biotin--[acetyl-CoA-carboxylase] ligase [Ilumatobacter sp.]|uniref:biotin--[acetyl-CoA-carboxylase] ligase n=1 Tax=Ilumatobacter sp. TaxID=1967498 RepID=UPI00391CA53F
MESTGSTNADLLREVEAGRATHRTVLVADHQSAGRGRLDRTWVAPPGANLLVSLLFTQVPANPTVLTHVVGISAARAIDPAVGLKWPNDLVVGDRKLAGVLAQREPTSGAVVVGIGVNVGWAPDGAALVHDLASSGEHPVSPLDLLAAMLGEIDALLAESPESIAASYRDRLVTLGQRVRVELPGDRVLLGSAVDVDELGRLLVDDDEGMRHVLDVGDVVHLRRS